MPTQSIAQTVDSHAETRSRERPSLPVAAAIGLGTLLGLSLAYVMELATRYA